MPPKATDQKDRRVIVAAPKSSEEESGDDMDISQDLKSSGELRKLTAAELQKHGDKASTKFTQLQGAIATLFKEARITSKERKIECTQYLAKMLSNMDALLQADVEPESSQIVELLGNRTKLSTKVATEHESLSGPVQVELEAAIHEANEYLDHHRELRERSRKRLMKYAQKDFKRGLEVHKLATDAHAYIKHYKKLIML